MADTDSLIAGLGDVSLQPLSAGEVSNWNTFTTSYGSAFTPSEVTPGATSWLDVVKYGIGRVADYKVGTLAVQSKAQELAVQDRAQQQITGSVADRQVAAGGLGGLSLGTLLLIGAAFLLLRG